MHYSRFSLYDIVIGDSLTTAAMAEREIVRRVEAHTGRKVGPWEVSCALFTVPDKKRESMVIATLSEVPERRFILTHGVITEAGAGFPALVRKMSASVPKMTQTIRGAEYDFVDFCVRVGLSFDRHNAACGVVVEIEYRPCLVAPDCADLIGELMERIAAPLVPPPQAGQDPIANAAATTAFTYKRIEVDPEGPPKDTGTFSSRSSALLYIKLLQKDSLGSLRDASVKK